MVYGKSITGQPLMITGMMEAVPSDDMYLVKPARCHNRQIRRAKILRGGIRKRNRAPYAVFGFRLWDRGKYSGKECFEKAGALRGTLLWPHWTDQKLRIRLPTGS